MPYYRRIKDLREDSDKTQAEVANYLGTTAQYYGKYEKGERELPFNRAVKLAEYYNVSLDYISGRTNAMQPQYEVSFSEEEIKLISCFRALSDRNKGKIELFINQLLDSQK